MKHAVGCEVEKDEWHVNACIGNCYICFSVFYFQSMRGNIHFALVWGCRFALCPKRGKGFTGTRKTKICLMMVNSISKLLLLVSAASLGFKPAALYPPVDTLNLRKN